MLTENFFFSIISGFQPSLWWIVTGNMTDEISHNSTERPLILVCNLDGWLLEKH